MTHELKTPVFSISILIQLVKDAVAKGKSHKAEELLDLMVKEKQQLQSHIDQVLELASLENGQYRLNVDQNDFHQLIEEVVEQFKFKLDAKDGDLIQRLKGYNPSLKY